MARSPTKRRRIENELKKVFRMRDMDTCEVLKLELGAERTVKMILSEWHRDGVLFYHRVTGKHTMRSTLAIEYMKDYQKYHKAMVQQRESIFIQGKWCRTLKPIEKARDGYTTLVAGATSSIVAAVIGGILMAQSGPDEEYKMKHLDMIIDIYLRDLLQALRHTGYWNCDVADQAFRNVRDIYLEEFGRHERCFIKILGKHARWRRARTESDELDRKGIPHVFR